MSEKKEKRGGSSKLLSILIGVAVSALLLWYLLADLQWQQLSETLQTVEILPLLGVSVFIFAGYFIRALRWRYLLPSGTTYSLKLLVQATAVGMLGIWLLPLRAGEFVRPWVLSRAKVAPFSAGLASIVIERVFDVCALLVLFVVCSFQIDSVPPIALAGMKALGVISGAILIVMVVAYVRGDALLRFFKAVVEKLVPSRYSLFKIKLNAIAAEFIDGLRALSTGRELLMTVFWSVLLWLCYGASYVLFLWSFGETGSVWPGFVVTVMVALAIAAPSAPGFLGTFQLGCVLALSGIYGYSREFAIAYSLVAHVLQAVIGVVLGGIALQTLGWKWQDLKGVSSDGGSAEVVPPRVAQPGA